MTALSRKSVGRAPAESDVHWLIAILAVACVMYAPTFRFLWMSWMSDSQYSLAFLVPFVSGYFVWKRWPEVRGLERSSSVWGALLIVFGLLFHLLGVALDVSGPSGWSMLVCIWGCCLYFRGPQFVRRLAFPLAYMLFLIPIPNGGLDMVGFPMQLWASGATAALLRAMGIEVVRNGVNLAVDGYSFQVAQACSGMSSLVALVGVTAVFAYLTRLPAPYKWLLFCLSMPIALLANVVRIATIALVGYEWGPDVATNMYHDWSSPILFLVAIGVLFMLNWGFEWLNARRAT